VQSLLCKVNENKNACEQSEQGIRLAEAPLPSTDHEIIPLSAEWDWPIYFIRLFDFEQSFFFHFQ